MTAEEAFEKEMEVGSGAQAEGLAGHVFHYNRRQGKK